MRTEKAAEHGIKASRKALVKAEKKLAKRGLSPQKLQESVAEGTEQVTKRGRKARKQLAKHGKVARKEFKQARKELHKNTAAAYKDLAAKFAKEQPKKRRRWPIVLLLVGGIGAAVAAVLAKRPEQVALHEVEEPQVPEQKSASNGKHTPSEPVHSTSGSSDNGHRK